MHIIAEVGQSHEGSLLEAVSYIEHCAAAGAWGVKFQRHIPGRDPSRQFRPGTWHPQDANRDAYWKRTGFELHEWKLLADRCQECGVQFGLSIFDPVGIQYVCDLVDFWKIPSTMAMSEPLRDALSKTAPIQPVFISCGLFDADAIGDIWSDYPGPLRYLHCVPEYPTRLERLGMSELEKVDGVSLHVASIWPALWAAAHGAQWCEVHVIRARDWSHVPDARSSLEIAELGRLIGGVRAFERMSGPFDPETTRRDARARYAAQNDHGGAGGPCELRPPATAAATYP